ncbi:MAG: oligosaccharide flippase family protein [Candidatus Marsarchaeota archaeon]|nr:oligosaccharide flippase family protein [Candidatus Marsarchaeota archaeon]
MDQKADTSTLELGVKSAKVASYIGLTHIISVIVAGVALIVLARLLQPDQYGIYTLAYSVWALFSASNLAGIGQYLNKYVPVWIARKKRNELSNDLGTGFVSLVLISLVAVAIGFALSGTISQYAFHSLSYVPLIDLALAAVLFTQLNLLAYNTLIGFKDGIGSAVAYDIGALATASASIGLVVLGYGVYGAIAGLIVGGVIGLAAGLLIITRHISIKLPIAGFGKRASRILAFSLPLAIASIINSAVSNFAVLFLGVFSTTEILGSYGVALRIATLVSTAAAFIGAVLVPTFSSALEGKNPSGQLDKLYNYSVYFGAAIGVPIAVYLIVLARSLVTSVFPAYVSSLLYTPLITVAVLIGVINTYAAALVVSVGDVKRVVKYTVIVGTVQFALLFLLVPLINAYGIIVGVYLIGNILANYLYMRHMKRRLKIETRLGGVYKIIAAGLMLGVALFAVSLAPINDTFKLAAGIAVMILLYPALLGLIRAIGREEMRLLSAISKSSGMFGHVVGIVVAYVSVFSGDVN